VLEIPFCPKRGVVQLFHKKYGLVYARTTCKTKSCRVCGPKQAALNGAIAEYGLRSLDPNPFSFITLTYYLGGPQTRRNAASVKADWGLMRLWLKEKYPETWWMKVVELTQRKQPHLHLILSSGKTSLTSCGAPKGYGYGLEWSELDCDCDEHDWSRAWHRITRDSYIVDVKPVDNAAGASWYLTKYITKAMNDPSMRRLGFKRVWSKSQNWPYEKSRLLATVLKLWEGKPVWVDGPDWEVREFLDEDTGEMTRDVWIDDEDNPHPVQERIGTDLALIMDEERRVKARDAKYRAAAALVGEKV